MVINIHKEAGTWIATDMGTSGINLLRVDYPDGVSQASIRPSPAAVGRIYRTFIIWEQCFGFALPETGKNIDYYI